MLAGPLILRDDVEHEFADAFAWLAALIVNIVPWEPVTVDADELLPALTAAWDMMDGRPSSI
jgi:hypothetical protein